ncbi:hypothetical protein DCC62_10560 [candidate division KSB1 bacterium]|nr:MAG: hypothetical protein DCC62_10560 [candidate division KSB1 bacterium]
MQETLHDSSKMTTSPLKFASDLAKHAIELYFFIHSLTLSLARLACAKPTPRLRFMETPILPLLAHQGQLQIVIRLQDQLCGTWKSCLPVLCNASRLFARLH